MSDKTIKEALKEASLVLKSPKEASILLRYLLKFDQVELILRENEKLENYKEYKKLIQRRENHEPIEYITNSVSFYSKEFFIKEGALIPRPETEILIDKAVEILKDIDSPKVAEIGTGSGIIAVMLALLVNDISIIATDISDSALKVARVNADRFDVNEKIEFKKRNYLDGIYDKFDMIISNPPYIADGYEIQSHLAHEPQNALFGGVVGDEILKDIIDIWKKQDTPYLLCEIGYDQKESMKSLLTGFDVEFYKDLAGFDRGFVARK
jgi:release factor glutamine methyltransferase